MNTGPAAAERRANRLLRWYRRSWRSRYGDEFVALLVDDMAERPRSISRTTDVVRGGVLARLSVSGLAGDDFQSTERLQAGVSTFALVPCLFLMFGLSVWSQLSVGWQWAPPDNGTTFAAMFLMYAGVVALGLATTFVLAALVLSAGHSSRARSPRSTITPMMVMVLSAVVLVLGSRYVGVRWPGTGGHAWMAQGIVPKGVASFCWALTMWVSSYWAHPGALGRFPVVEVAWMIISPVATLAFVAGLGVTLRRIELRAGFLTFIRAVVPLVSGAMIIFVAGACLWLVSGATRHPVLFHTGIIDDTSLACMVLALLAARAVGGRLQRYRRVETA